MVAWITALLLEVIKGFIWIQPTGFPSGLDVGYRRTRWGKDESMFPSMSSSPAQTFETAPDGPLRTYSCPSPICINSCPFSNLFFTLQQDDLFKAQNLSVDYNLLQEKDTALFRDHITESLLALWSPSVPGPPAACLHPTRVGFWPTSHHDSLHRRDLAHEFLLPAASFPLLFTELILTSCLSLIIISLRKSSLTHPWQGQNLPLWEPCSAPC